MSATSDGAPSSADDLAIPVVTIPLSEFAELLEAKRRIDVVDARARRYPVPPKSPMELDPEIADLFKERFGKVLVDGIVRRCAACFGRARTPARTAAYTCLQRLREGLTKQQVSNRRQR